MTCRGHYLAWFVRAPDGLPLREWVQTGPDLLRTDQGLPCCRVTNCQFGVVSSGFCPTHTKVWTRAGRPDPTLFAATCHVNEELAARAQPCLLGDCAVWRDGNSSFCASHRARYSNRRQREPGLDEATFVRDVAIFAKPKLRIGGLPLRLQLEVGYTAQTYFDHGHLRTRFETWQPWVDLIQSTGASSILDHPVAYWHDKSDQRWRVPNTIRHLFTWSWDELDKLISGSGWDSEYDRDVWRKHRLGYGKAGKDYRAVLRFDLITQQWLRDLSKRWIRQLLSTGRAECTVSSNLATLRCLSTFLQRTGAAAEGPHELTREVVEAWLADVATSSLGMKSRRGRINNMRAFLLQAHRRGWSPTLPATAAIYSEDLPRRANELEKARAVPEFVMRQIEVSLPQLHDASARLALELMIRCGLRSADALQLGWDCVVRDHEGHPYLRYLNHKMSRTAFVPLDEDLPVMIAEQQTRSKTECLVSVPVHLFPAPKRNARGDRSLSYTAWRARVDAWLEALQLHDELGQAVRITPHQFRHTFATRLINMDVPQHIVQELLDHASPEMTAHYARLHNSTIRQAWSKARKINAYGDDVELAHDHPLSEASWLRAGLNTAKQTLPNGYCGMPAHSPCEHANPCLTCPLFLTTPEFLPQHQAQHRTTLQLIETAQRDGHQRVVEKNKEVATNLERIIAACQACDTSQVVAGGRVITPGAADAH